MKKDDKPKKDKFPKKLYVVPGYGRGIAPSQKINLIDIFHYDDEEIEYEETDKGGLIVAIYEFKKMVHVTRSAK